MKLRAITADDFPAVLDLHQRSETFDRIPRILTMSELEHTLSGVRTTLETDTILVEIDGQIVGYLYTLYLPSDVRLERCYITGLVDPHYRRMGVADQMVRWGMARAEALLRSSGSSLPKYIRADHYDFVDGPAQLFTSFGMQPVRYYNEMRRAVDPVPETVLQMAEVDIVPWPADRSEEIRAVKNAAFADHWGSTPTSTAAWLEWINDEQVRLDLSFVALNRENKIVGCCLNERYSADDKLSDRKEAWISSIATLSAYRGTGIASSLIRSSLRAFADDGLTHACLGVDSNSPTGAQALYERLGFEPFSRSITYELLLNNPD